MTIPPIQKELNLAIDWATRRLCTIPVDNKTWWEFVLETKACKLEVINKAIEGNSSTQDQEH